jgi:hypothetical protein
MVRNKKGAKLVSTWPRNARSGEVASMGLRVHRRRLGRGAQRVKLERTSFAPFGCRERLAVSERNVGWTSVITGSEYLTQT